MDQTQAKGSDDHILQTPLWVSLIRGFQLLLSFIIFAMCCVLIHDAYLDEEGFSLAVSLLTWLAIGYIVLTEKIVGFRGAYHIIAVVVVDALLVILWLAAFASMAAKRAAYVVPVSVSDCYDDGDLVNSKTCVRRRAVHDQMMKRDDNVILFKSGLAMTAAIAGLGALVWLLFIACLVWEVMGWVSGRKQGRFGASTTGTAVPAGNNYQMEGKIEESQPMSPQTYPSQTQTQPQTQPIPFQDAPQGQYQQQQQQQQYQQQQQQQQQYAPTPQNTQNPYQPPQSPYQQGQAYPPPTQSPAPYPPQGQQQQQNFNQYAPPQQPATYSSELDAHQYPPSAVSPPPQPYQQQPYQQQ